MTNLYEEYAQIEVEIAKLETKKEQLRPHILQMMLDKGEKKIETAVGSFTRSVLKKWSFPKRITDLEDEFKAEKEKAKSTGEATFEEQDSLRFTMIKL